MKDIPQDIIEKLAFPTVITILMVIMGIAGEMDYEDAKAFEKQYIIEVCTGQIPNYKEWKIDCEVPK